MAFATVVVPYNNFASGISFSDSPNPDTSTCFDEKANDIYVFVSRPLDCKGASPDPESLADTLEKSLGINFDGLVHGPSGIKGKCMPICPIGHGIGNQFL